MLTEKTKRCADLATNPLNVQEGGDHYKKWPIQPVEFSMLNNLNLCQANVVKYVCRFRDKGGKEDLLKARHYIDLLIYFHYGIDDNDKGYEKLPEEVQKESAKAEPFCQRLTPAYVSATPQGVWQTY